MPTVPCPLTPYDTGERLEPRPWSTDGDPERYGRVDFDDDEGATVLSVHVERLPSGACALHVIRVSDVDLVVHVRGEHSLTIRPAITTEEKN